MMMLMNSKTRMHTHELLNMWFIRWVGGVGKVKKKYWCGSTHLWTCYTNVNVSCTFQVVCLVTSW